MIDSGFVNWSKNDFKFFIKNIGEYPQQSFFAKIAETTGKKVEDVKKYTEVFFERIHELENSDAILAKIE